MAPLPGRAGAADLVTPCDADGSAFEEEIGPLLNIATRLATGMLLNTVEAEDAVQEACVRAWRHRANRRAGTDLRLWFLGIVANQCREARRGRWWSVLRMADVSGAAPTGPTDLSLALALRQALSQLPHRRRAVLVLRYYLDLPLEEVAAATGCSVDSAKALIRRGTADLKRALSMPEASS